MGEAHCRPKASESVTNQGMDNLINEWLKLAKGGP